MFMRRCLKYVCLIRAIYRAASELSFGSIVAITRGKELSVFTSKNKLQLVQTVRDFFHNEHRWTHLSQMILISVKEYFRTRGFTHYIYFLHVVDQDWGECSL